MAAYTTAIGTAAPPIASTRRERRMWSVRAITWPSGMHRKKASTFIVARHRIECQSSLSLTRSICVV
jgi:hypothetical protein